MKSKSHKLRVVMVIPNTRWFGKRPWIMWPYSALILTALLKEEFDFKLLEANVDNLSEAECKDSLKEMFPDIVIVSAFSVEYSQQSHLAISCAKEACPNCITVMGGVYPTVLSDEVMEKDANVDYIFVGHGEDRVGEFFNIIAKKKERLQDFAGIGYRDDNGKVVINPVKSYISNVKEIVKPDYSLIKVDKYLDQRSKDYQLNSDRRSVPIISTYGCPYNCIFCASRTVSGRKTVYRPIEDVLKEIEYLIYEHKVENLLFLDDNLLGNKLRIEAILNAFIDRKYNITWKAATVAAWHCSAELLELMKRSGCTQITISVESGSKRVLKEIIKKPLKLEIIPRVVKKCKEVGIDIGGNFVIGFPGETWEEIRESFRFAEYCDFDLVHFHIATPLPKTDLYDIAKKGKLLPDDFSFTDPRYFGFCQGFITTDEFTPFELMILRAFEWDRINFKNPEKIAKIAKMMNLSVEQLSEHRKETRRKGGIHF